MTLTLTLTERGQVTLNKSILRHLGIKPGQKITLETMPDGRATLQAKKRTGTIEDLFGLLEGETDKKATLEEIEQAIADGWAGLVKVE